MGGSFGWKTQDDMVKALTIDMPGVGYMYHTEKHSVVEEYGKPVLWCVVKCTDQSGKVERFISCYLLDILDGKWGYKSYLEEWMGPKWFSCPLPYLKCAAVPNEWGAEWRKRVREYHDRRKAA